MGKHWDTDRVFYSREEADEYGREFSYNYRSGWRVYSVPAHGELASMLKQYAEQEEAVSNGSQPG